MYTPIRFFLSHAVGEPFFSGLFFPAELLIIVDYGWSSLSETLEHCITQ